MSKQEDKYLNILNIHTHKELNNSVIITYPHQEFIIGVEEYTGKPYGVTTKITLENALQYTGFDSEDELIAFMHKVRLLRKSDNTPTKLATQRGLADLSYVFTFDDTDNGNINIVLTVKGINFINKHQVLLNGVEPVI